MKNATKILLLISGILSFVVCAAYFICAIIFFVFAATSMSITGITYDEAIIAQTTFMVFGILFLVFGLFAIPAGILSFKCRNEFTSGKSSKDAMRPKAIWLIVLGALSFEFPIVPAIFLLAMNEKHYH